MHATVGESECNSQYYAIADTDIDSFLFKYYKPSVNVYNISYIEIMYCLSSAFYFPVMQIKVINILQDVN